MKLSTSRYSFCLMFQIVAIVFDLFFNCISLFPRSRDGLLVIFIFQDLFLVLSITTMLITLFSTYLFQAGLVEVLIRKFRAAGSVCLAYMVASVVLHTAWLLDKWTEKESISSPLLIALFTIQRVLSPWYYFVAKRAALRVADPRMCEDVDWINGQLATR
ncbi:transmembrane protein 138 [Ostrinia nubilalis]|uniref:transmembrane protein 138 n=1 Tax=Ostrinia furnacalis TaxID=93504 RepID=UPI00103E829D|nr:transmembrane protein 138 [Ostrinia furnacalis]